MLKRLTSLAFLGLSLSLVGCYSSPEPGVAVITVLDANDFRVPEAQVRFYQSGNGAGIIDEKRFTNLQGVCTFIHGKQAYQVIDEDSGRSLIALCGEDAYCEVILNVTATSQNKLGTTIVRIKPGETIQETVRIY
jgi:hypothetical protein